jgi:predicted DsbA family dithiol-disulfide isomerase
LAHKLAIENEHISADVVEVSEFIDIAQRYQVRGVPKTVVNEHIEIMGAVPEPRFVQEVLKAIEPKSEQQ